MENIQKKDMSSHEILFVMIQHGFMGMDYDFRNMILAIRASNPTAVIWTTPINHLHKTHEGVEKCGKRLASELAAELRRQHESQTDAVVKFCALGHSMGGIILRYALSALPEDILAAAWLDWTLFLTTASPHLGCSGLGPVVRAGAWALGNLCSQGVHDLFLASDVMSEYLCAEAPLDVLRRFRFRYLYSNTSDHLVTYQTAALHMMNPAEVVAKYPPVEGHPHVREVVILDPLANGPDDNAAMYFSKATQGTVRRIHHRLRGVGRWHLHTVHFTECLFSHMAIIQHARKWVSLSSHGKDVVEHIGKVIAEVVKGPMVSTLCLGESQTTGDGGYVACPKSIHHDPSIKYKI